MNYEQIQQWLETRDPICSVCKQPTYRFDISGIDVQPVRPTPPPAPVTGRRTYSLTPNRRTIQELIVTCESCGQISSFDLAVITPSVVPPA
jgi:hypothetical protein